MTRAGAYGGGGLGPSGQLGSQATSCAPSWPPNQDAAITLFFREKGFWTFGRGQRLGDLRRLIRQYGRTEDKVFPEGIYSFIGTASGTYGDDVNFPVPDTERPNPEFKGCLDRKA